MEHFDASAPPAEQPEPASLLAMQARDAEDRLTRALDHVAEVVARVRERGAEDELDPDLVAIMEEITSAPDASLELASLGRRVRDGFTTWQAVWHDPTADPAARHLVIEVQRVVLARARLARAAAAAEQQRS